MKRHEISDRMREIQSEIPNKKLTISAAQKELTALEREYHKLAQMLAPKKSDKPSVSDHALLRYIERVQGFDIEAIRKHILSPDIESAIRNGASAINIEGVSFKVSGGVITTILEN